MSLSSLLSWLNDAWMSIGPGQKWTLATVSLVYSVYKLSTWNFGVFRRLGVKGPRPWPVVGTTKELIRLGLREHDLSLKRQYGPVVGIFNGHSPCLLVYDLEMLKHILVKDFHNFRNRKVPPIPDYPFDLFVHVLQDDHWKYVRSVLSPAFSTGKLRKMQQQIEQCAATLIDNLQQKADAEETFDFLDYCGAYTMDVIASTAFGLQIDTHNDPNNELVRMSKRMWQFSFRERKAIFFFFFPSLIRPLSKFGVRMFPAEVIDFFVDLVNESRNQRKSQSDGNTRVDLLQLIIDAEVRSADSEDEDIDKDTDAAAVTSGESSSPMASSEGWNKTRRGLTRDEVVAQGMFFLFAGYETTANTLAFLGYLLAVNSECQEKLIEEIDSVMDGQDHVTYDVIKRMPYLDMCVSETLRMYPAGPRTDRVAAADITVNGVFIPKGMHIEIPIYAIQNDPEYWPNPERFHPERFLPEAKATRNPYCYMPFGVGPHNCVGMRLALVEMKMAVVHILQRFTLVAGPETQIPLQLDMLRVRPSNGIKIKVRSRSS